MAIRKSRRKVDEDGLEDEFPKVIELPVLSHAEMDLFGEWIERFRETKEIYFPSKATIHPLNIRKAMDSFGAMKNDKVVVEVLGVFKGKTSYKMPTLYDLFWNKFDQWNDRKSKREYAKRKDLEGLAEMAETMRVV